MSRTTITLSLRSWAPIVALACCVNVASAQVPRIGEVQTVNAISVSVHVGSMGSESKQAVFTPPPGWYIRRHFVQVTQRYGNTSYTVSTVPSNWSWSSSAVTNQAHRQVLEFTVPIHSVPVPAKLGTNKGETLQDRHAAHSSHHALILDVAAKGEHLFQGGAGIQLNVIVELVYVGLPVEPARQTYPNR